MREASLGMKFLGRTPAQHCEVVSSNPITTHACTHTHARGHTQEKTNWFSYVPE